MDFKFVDEYTIAGVSPGSEIIKSRTSVFTKLRKELTAPKVVELIKFYYDLNTSECPGWMFDPFQKADATFSQKNNKRECKTLARCLIKAALADNSIPIALGVLTASVGLAETKDEIDVQLPEIAAFQLLNIALENKKKIFNVAPFPDISIPTKNTAIEAFVTSGELPKLSSILKTMVQETIDLQKNVNMKLGSVNLKAKDLQQENEILWWYVGAWSTLLNTPFDTLDAPLCGLMLGADLANLSNASPGPAAIKPLIHKMLEATKVDKNKEISIADLVDTYGLQIVDKLLPMEAKVYQPLCPLLTALSRFKEIGEVKVWVNSYQVSFGYNAQLKFKPLDLGLQIYRELMLIKHTG